VTQASSSGNTTTGDSVDKRLLISLNTLDHQYVCFLY
jgi:hypothetical protein